MADVITATPTASGASVSDMIDAIPLYTGEGSTDTPDTATNAPGDLETPAVPAESGQEETTDTTTQAAPVAAEPEELDPADPLDPDQITQDAKGHKRMWFTENKTSRLFQARDFKNAVEQELGPDANVDAIKGMYRRDIELARMMDDYDSADPERMAGVAEHFLSDARNPNSPSVLTDHLMATLAAQQPQAYNRIAGKVIDGWVGALTKSPDPSRDQTFSRVMDVAANALYRMAVERNNPQLEKVAQHIEYSLLNRQFRNSQQVLQQQQQPDPLAAERARFEREREEFYGLRRQEQSNFVARQVEAATAAVRDGVTAEIAKALSPVAEKMKALPNGAGEVHMRHMQRDLQDAVDEARKATPAWEQKFKLEENRFRANPSDEARDRLVNMMTQFANGVIAKKRNAVIQSATGLVLGNNAAAHAKQQQLAARREPAGAAVTAPDREAFRSKLTELKKSGMGAREALETFWGER